MRFKSKLTQLITQSRPIPSRHGAGNLRAFVWSPVVPSHIIRRLLLISARVGCTLVRPSKAALPMPIDAAEPERFLKISDGQSTHTDTVSWSRRPCLSGEANGRNHPRGSHAHASKLDKHITLTRGQNA